MNSATGILIALPFLAVMAYAGARFAPWLPTHRRDLKRGLDLAGLKAGETFYDLGCGDGRVVFEAARRGAKATGVEIGPIALAAFVRNALRPVAGARIRFADLFAAPLAEADVVYLFGTPKTLRGRLREKLERELKPGARVVSYAFAVEGWTPERTDREDGGLPIHLYLR